MTKLTPEQKLKMMEEALGIDREAESAAKSPQPNLEGLILMQYPDIDPGKYLDPNQTKFSYQPDYSDPYLKLDPTGRLQKLIENYKSSNLSNVAIDPEEKKRMKGILRKLIDSYKRKK